MSRRFVLEEDAQGLVEYGLILGLIAIIAMAALAAMGTSVDELLTTIANTLSAISS